MKKNYPSRVAVSGCNGRMGKEVIHALMNVKDLVLTVLLCRKRSEFIDTYTSSIPIKKNIIIHDDIDKVKDNFDILIDFTNPEISISYLEHCHLYKKNMVIGTTGFSDLQMNKISMMSKDIGIVLSENFSAGINATFLLLKKLASIIEENADIEIIEIHHAKKIQLPSETSIKMRKIIQESFLRKKSDSMKKKQEIFQKMEIYNKNKKVTIHSIRAKNVSGEHSVIFFLDKEKLEIKHKIYDLSVFSDGAIRAAIWIQNQRKNGLFNMLDVLNL